MTFVWGAETRAESVTNSVNRLLTEHGASAVSMRAVAELTRLSPGSLNHEFGSKAGMLRRGAILSIRSRRCAIIRSLWEHRALAFLPEEYRPMQEHYGLDSARCWLAWLEIGRVTPDIGPLLADARAEDRFHLSRAYDFRVSPTDLDLMTALIDGLTVACCSQTDPMSLEHARQLLADHVQPFEELMDVEEPQEP